MAKLIQKSDIKIDSYKDCAWYIKDLDKCKLPNLRGTNSECYCKNGMRDFCVWVTKFMKSGTEPLENNKEVDMYWDEYNDLVFDEELNNIVKIENSWLKGLNNIFKQLYIT